MATAQEIDTPLDPLTANNLDAIHWMRDNNFIRKNASCRCNNLMTLEATEDTTFVDKFMYFCSNGCTVNTFDKSVTFGSYFHESRIPLRKWLCVISLWSTHIGPHQAYHKMTMREGLSRPKVINVYDDLRRVCVQYFNENTKKLGKKDAIVYTDFKISSSKVRMENKPPRSWIYLMIDFTDESGIGYLEIINEDKPTKTTLDILDTKYIDPASDIVKVRENVDQQVRIYGYWEKYKYLKEKMNVADLECLKTLLCEMMWMDRFHRTPVKSMCEHMESCEIRCNN